MTTILSAIKKDGTFVDLPKIVEAAELLVVPLAPGINQVKPGARELGVLMHFHI